MEPIQDDIERDIREAIDRSCAMWVLEEFDRLVAERDRLQAEVERWKRLYRVADKESADLEAERDRLIQALEDIAAMEAEPVKVDGRTCIEVAREALTKTTEEPEEPGHGYWEAGDYP